MLERLLKEVPNVVSVYECRGELHRPVPSSYARIDRESSKAILVKLVKAVALNLQRLPVVWPAMGALNGRV